MAKTYDTYKDSGIAWIGEIPGEWEVKKLKYSCKLYGRIGFRGYTADDLVDEGEGAITLSPTNFDGMKLNYSHCSFLNWDKYEESPEIKVYNGDVVLVKTASVGKCAYVSNLPLECTVNPQILVLKEHKDYSKFIAYLFNTKLGEAYIDTTKGGSTIYTISQEKIGNYIFPFPPLSVQQSISSFLDTKCGEIDSLISIQEEMISELLAYKQSVITEAVTKGLDKKAKMKNSGVEWIGDIPEEWEVIKIQYLNQGLTDGTHGTYNRVDKGRLLLSSKNVREKDLLITDSESQISEEDYQSIISNGFPKKGDLLMCCIGASIGRCIIYKYDETYAFQRSVIFIRCNKLIKPELLRYNLLSNNSLLQELFLINQSAQAGLYQGQVKEIKVIVPPISKQKQIIDYLDEKTFQIDSLIALKQSKIESLKEYKKSIIYEYVTGKKRV